MKLRDAKEFVDEYCLYCALKTSESGTSKEQFLYSLAYNRLIDIYGENFPYEFENILKEMFDKKHAYTNPKHRKRGGMRV